MAIIMIAGKPVNFGALPTVYKQAQAKPLSLPGATITGTSSRLATESASFKQSASIFSNILRGGELPETFRESVTTTNLINLGKASVDISNALNTVASGLQSQINSARQNIAPLVPQVMAPEEQPLPLTSTLKNSLSSGFGKASEAIGISAATLGIILVGVSAFMLLRRRN